MLAPVGTECATRIARRVIRYESTWTPASAAITTVNAARSFAQQIINASRHQLRVQLIHQEEEGRQMEKQVIKREKKEKERK